jgi:hypothetical protein
MSENARSRRSPRFNYSSVIEPKADSDEASIGVFFEFECNKTVVLQN